MKLQAEQHVQLLCLFVSGREPIEMFGKEGPFQKQTPTDQSDLFYCRLSQGGTAQGFLLVEGGNSRHVSLLPVQLRYAAVFNQTLSKANRE